MSDEIKSFSSLKETIKTRDEDHVRILATLVPDEIIYRDERRSSGTSMSSMNGVLLFVDVSGFTDLCERYSALGKGGPSRITQVLNAYMGAMVQEIMSHGGDILKFSGDAFLALWKSNDDVSMSDVVHAAIDCALGIQRSHGTYKTEVQITLRVKIALAAGPVKFTVIGNSAFMVLGKTMLELKDIGNICSPGDIIMSLTMEDFLNPNEYLMERIPQSPSIKILSIGSEWTPSTLSNQFEIFDAFAITDTERKEVLDDESELVVIDDDDDANRPAYYSYMLRPSLDYAANRNLGEYLRNFIIAPVVQAIESNSPLDYMTEMRQVVIVFINIVVPPLEMKQTIRICTVTYSIVCDTVTKLGGCVNKVSLFDKDLMFLVIFGLRGFKHALEAQKALYCARETLKLLKTVSSVESVAVGVTTGKTYCGVVGHPMRKEYTVIGRTVNKAARLMVAYPDIVTCDRQTFLHSQLQARYFALQPERYLKGFKNVGPIYKFLDKSIQIEELETALQKVRKYPLLNRETEMEFFFNVVLNKRKNLKTFINIESSIKLSSIVDLSSYNMMIIKGQDRQGKTRLLYEIIIYTESECPYIFYSFTPDDINKPCKLFQEIFSKYCDLSTTNVDERSKNVFNFLQPFKVPEFLCALNKILLTNFEETKYWNRLTDEQKYFVMCKMIKYLCIKAFRKSMCIILLDNTENMDEKSWCLLRTFLSTEFVFVCATMGPNVVLGAQCKRTMERPDVKIMSLKPINKFFISGLICQFLDVGGVDLELERYNHEHSNGNPGWIESYLTTLLHSNAIRVEEFSKQKAHMEGFVLPPYEMISRVTMHNFLASSAMLIESNKGSFLDSYDVNIEDWDIYAQTIKEEKVYGYQRLSLDIKIITITGKFSSENMDTEVFLDVHMIKTYDYLKVHEQLLLKCSSILGDSFPRHMLEYVMQSQSERKNAEAIQSLFEIGVFSCGRAKYTDGAIQVNHYLKDPNVNTNIECYCSGFPISLHCHDLPKYANCGFIRFREPLFRQMLINLLTDCQANLYHVRSMWYLESQTRRCLACGLGYFTTLIGQSNDDGMKRYSLEHISSLMRITSDMDTQSSEEFENRKRKSSLESLSSATQSLIRTKETVKSINMIKTQTFRTFADNNIFGCECDNILISMYKQMIEHCQGAGVHEKLMHAILEYAALCIKLQNITVGITLIDKATRLLDNKLQYELPEPAWQVPLIRGKIMHLTGQLHTERTAYDDAEKSLIEALKCFNLKFPSGPVSCTLEIMVSEMKQNLIVNYFPHRYIGSRNEDICTLAEHTAEVLASLFMLFRRKFQFKRAYLASVWGMNEALRSDSNFAVMCQAYSNILTMDLIYNKTDFVSKLEDMAIDMCYRKHTRLEKHELEAVSKLYGAIFLRKCLCQNMIESVKLGYIILQLNSPQYGGNNRWLMLPLMIHVLILTYMTSEAAVVIKQMSFFKKLKMNHFAPMTYYTLSLTFRIYTAHNLEPFEEIEACGIVKLISYEKKILTVIEMRYHAYLWLWYVRRNDWESASTLYEHINAMTEKKFTGEPATLFICIYLIEGHLLTIVKKIDICDDESVKNLIVLVNRLLKNMEEITIRHICLRSRILLLKAYYFMIFKKEKEAFKLLEKASEYAKKCCVLYDVDWIEYTRELWLEYKVNPHKDNDEWLEATGKEIILDWEHLETAHMNIPFFSFRLPAK